MANLETILNIRVEGTSEMVKLKDQITKTEAGLKKLKDAQKQAGENGKKFTSSIVQAETKLKGLRKELNSNKNDLLKLNAATQENTKSYNSLTKANAALSIQLRKLGDPLGKNKKQFDELSGKMNKNEAQLIKMDKAMGRSQRNVGNYGAAFSGMAMKVGMAVAAFKAMERAVSIFVDFEFQIKQTAMLSSATAAEMKLLADAAKELGASTSFTAGEVAGLQKELAKAGFDPTEIINMTTAVMDLAFAFDEEAGPAAETTAAAMKSFNLESSETAHVTDIMGKAFASSLLDMEKFSVAMPKVGVIANQMGFSFEDTTVMLAHLANTGMEASTSATALKNIFLKLADPTGDLAVALGRNISSIDEMIPAMQELEASGIDVAGMLEITDKRSVTAFASLLTGTESLEKLNVKINDSEGFMKTFADEMRDSLKGSIDETKSAAEGFVLVLVEKMAPVLRIVLDIFKGLFSVLSFLSPVIIGLTSAFVTYKTVMVAARVMTYLFNAALVLGKVVTIAMAIGTNGLTASMKALNLAMKANPLGLVVSIGAGAIAMFSSMGDEVEETTEVVEELSAAEQDLINKQEELIRQAEQRKTSQAEEIGSVKSLIRTIKDETQTRKDRMSAIKDLNEIAGTNIKNLDNEIQLAKDLELAYNNAVDAIKAKYIVQGAEAEILELVKEEMEFREIVENSQGAIALKQEEINKYKRDELYLTEAIAGETEQGMEALEIAGGDRVLLQKMLTEASQRVWEAESDMGLMLQGNISITENANDLSQKQNDIYAKAQKIIENLLVVKKEDNNQDDKKLTAYEKLQQAVKEEQKELKRLIILRNAGKVSQEVVTKQIGVLKQAKIDLNIVDKEVAEEQKKINDLFKKTEEVQKDKIALKKEEIEADEVVLDNMKHLAENGAQLTKEIIQQSLDIAQAKLKMAMATIEASETSTAIEVENINKLKEKVAGFQADMKALDANQPATGWLNKSLFGSGAGDEGEGYTGADFLGDLTTVLGEVSGVMDEVSALQNERLNTQLGVIETEKTAEIEAYKKTAAFAVLSTEEQDTALANIAKKHDDEMLALKISQFERDKKMDISQAIMKGAMGIMNIWGGNITGNPLADAIIKGILTTAMVATTGLQIATIKSTAPPTAELGGIEGESFAVGGMVQGKSHAQGGEKFAVGGRVVELEGGEAVINKRSTAMFKPQLSAMNSAGGGKKFADGGMVFATDMLETQATSMENMILNNDPQQVLLVEADVTNSQRSVANIEAKASF